MTHLGRNNFSWRITSIRLSYSYVCGSFLYCNDVGGSRLLLAVPPRQVDLGCVRKVAEQEPGIRPIRIIPPWFVLQVPVFNSCPCFPWWWKQINNNNNNKNKKQKQEGTRDTSCFNKACKAELFLFSIKDKECSMSLNFSRRFPEKPNKIKALMLTA